MKHVWKSLKKGSWEHHDVFPTKEDAVSFIRNKKNTLVNYAVGTSKKPTHTVTSQVSSKLIGDYLPLKEETYVPVEQLDELSNEFLRKVFHQAEWDRDRLHFDLYDGRSKNFKKDRITRDARQRLIKKIYQRVSGTEPDRLHPELSPYKNPRDWKNFHWV